MAEMSRAHVIISGRVQGVFFRAETQRAARQLGLNGWVRNRPEGTVEALFEGPREQVDSALNWCHQGSTMSQVTDVQVTWQTFSGDLKDFSIRR